ncbi:neutral/alkaline non-lysosomal ceramidase N-terminal domain-containing protein [soil metagenome]
MLIKLKIDPDLKTYNKRIMWGILIPLLFVLFNFSYTFGNEYGWKAGVAKEIITPEEPMWMAGYSARDHTSENIMHDLWVKALALEDASGNKSLIITADLLGWPKTMADRIRDRLDEKFQLSRAQIILSSSHTHSGPVLQNALYDIYPLDPQQLDKINKYSLELEDKIIDLVGKAFQFMQPVRIFANNGVTRFQVNRRNNIESTIDTQTELKGPNDYAVPVIKVENEKGEIVAILFGYACHPTVLDQYSWSGDYPGFAQLELEKSHPGTTALFFQGAGGDQNPLPRRTKALAEQYGKDLAAAVERVLEEPMRELASVLTTAYSEIDLPLNSPPAEEELTKALNESTSYIKQWGSRNLEMLKRGDSFISSYRYPLQVWKLGDQSFMALGGELVIEYAIELKRIFGKEIFVMGYANDVMAYIPSETILEEGGYEGNLSQMVYGLPGKWKPGIQALILDEMVKLASNLDIVHSDK